MTEPNAFQDCLGGVSIERWCAGMNDEGTGAVEYPIDGVLDLHMFRPDEARSAVEEYLTACHEHGIGTVRIIHGKGRGVLRNIVQSLLVKSPLVREFYTAPDSSGWGATIAVLDSEHLTNSGLENGD